MSISSNYIAVSPDGQITATFNSESCTIKFYKIENLDKPTVISCNEITKLSSIKGSKVSKVSRVTKVFYSLAISNFVRIGGNDDALIAISRFGDKDMIAETNDNFTSNLQNKSTINVVERGDVKTGTTFVISKNLQTRIETAVDTCGGVVKFLADQSNGFTNLIVMNASGIKKTFISHNSYVVKHSSSSIAEEYELPTTVQAKINKFYQKVPCTGFLQNIIESNYLFAEDCRNKRVEMYNLKSLDLEMVFQKHDETPVRALAFGNPIFSISNCGDLLAHCNATIVTIYLMENGLEVISKNFTNANRILSVSFIDDDEKLFIVTEEENGYDKNGKIKFTSMINSWDLFTYKNDIRKVADNEKFFSSLQEANDHSVARSHGTILGFLQNGNVMKYTLTTSNIPSNLSTNIFERAQQNTPVRHSIFYKTWLDAKNEQKEGVLIVNNNEPWVHNKYRSISSYLDENKTIQLVIGETTVQVWRKKSNDSRKLEYIWANPSNTNIEATSLKVGNCEFSLVLSLLSPTISQDEKCIHWPNEVHALKDACGAIEYLYEREDELVRPKDQRKYKELVTYTEKLIKRCIKKNPDRWKLADIRYETMANLIRARSVLLLHQILFEKADFNDKNTTRVSRYLHIPRWSVKEKGEKKSDLEMAIEVYSDIILYKGEHHGEKEKAIVAMLLEYYSNNAEKNTGWMFTVTNAVPLLNKRHLENYLKELFYKPCFGTKVECLNSKLISPYALKTILNIRYDTEVPLNIKPQLLKKDAKNPLSIPTLMVRSRNGEQYTPFLKLHVVPLPDFTVYPTNATDKPHNKWMNLLELFLWPRVRNVDQHVSPFLKFVRENKNEILYDNPAMEACINFRWSAMRIHFIYHLLRFIIFINVLIYASCSVIKHKDTKSSSSTIISTGFYLSHIVLFYLGYYLLVTEIKKLIYGGFKYQKNFIWVYNLFDLGSIVISMIAAIFGIIIVKLENDEFKKAHIILQAYSILFLFFEFMILMRFFPPFENYVYMILNILKVAIFFMYFMALFITAIGAAMFTLLHIESVNNKTNEQQTSQNTNDNNDYDSIPSSIMAVFFWILGRWGQLEKVDSTWSINVLTIIGGILLVVILQNMLIAFMTDALAYKKSSVLKYKADLIAYYEPLFVDVKGNPRYIYYIRSSGCQEEWLRKYRNHRSLIDDVDNQLLNDLISDDDDNDDDDDDKMNED